MLVVQTCPMAADSLEVYHKWVDQPKIRSATEMSDQPSDGSEHGCTHTNSRQGIGNAMHPGHGSYGYRVTTLEVV